MGLTGGLSERQGSRPWGPGREEALREWTFETKDISFEKRTEPGRHEPGKSKQMR